MGDSSSFTSLHELVQSHLSKISVQDTQSDTSVNQVPVTKHELTAQVMETGFLTPVQLLNPPGRLVPSMVSSTSSNDAVSVLAQQVANMFKAKELKRLEEEKKLLKGEVNLMPIDDYLIDFSSSIIDTSLSQPTYMKENNCHEDSDCDTSTIKELETHLSPKIEKVQMTHDNDSEIDEKLPCAINVHYLLTTKPKKPKCSSFGRVLCSRYASKGPLYKYKHYPSSIVRFKFNTLSPDDFAIMNAKKIDKKVDFLSDFALQKSEMLTEREKANGYKSQRGICFY